MRRGPKGLFTFFFKQQKRLFSRPAFLALLIIIILMSFALSVVSDESGGILRVGLADESGEPMVSEMIDRLMEDNVMASFEELDREQGIAAVEAGELDAVWIFEEDFTRVLSEVAMGKNSSAPITVITGADSSVKGLARERLYATVFPYASEFLYEGFNSEELGITDEQSDAVIESISLNDDVVIYETLSGESPTGSGDFLRLTLCGLLALCVLLCAFACTMYALKDAADGVYDFLPQRARFFPLLIGVFSGTLDAGAVACVAIAISGNRLNLMDLFSMLMYVLAVTSFAFLVGSLCARREVLGTVLPVVIFVSALLSPIFINIAVAEPVRLLLPTYLYLRAYGDSMYCVYMLIYAMAAGLLSYPVFCVRTKK